jgi:hypothetical protein
MIPVGYGDSYGDDYGYDIPGAAQSWVGIQQYINLLTSQYQMSANMKALLAAMLQKVGDIASVLADMDSNFDLDEAVGPQLDILGQIVGVAREVDFQPSDSVSPVLNDPTYRILLKAKIIQNQWDGKIGSLYAAWASLFPGGKIIINDGQNMTAAITMSGTFSSIIVDLINNGYIVPRPQGVLYTYGFGTMPFFGFDRSDSFIAGFDTGKFE